MKLKLKRPIVFFDLETTGVNTSSDRIVEISMIKIMPDGEEISIGAAIYNPAFDVTPHELITGFITENGIFSAIP